MQTGNWKKRFVYGAVLCMLYSLLVGNTLAYFTAEDTARNVITTGGVHVQVVEQQLADGGLQPYPEEPIRVMPGSTVSKIVSVRNLAEPAWIRMACDVTLLDEKENEIRLTDDQQKAILAFDTDTENWTYADGWWYYKQAVSAAGTTKPLFTEVAFSATGMGNAYQNATVLIHVTAQAVQQANNGQTVTEAAGWPNA